MKKVIAVILTVAFMNLSLFTNNAAAMLAPASAETSAVIPQSNNLNPTAVDPALEAMQVVAAIMNAPVMNTVNPLMPASVTAAPTTVVTVIAPPAAVVVTAPAAAAAESTAPPVEAALVVEPPAAEAAFIEPEVDITDTTDTDDVIDETDMEDTVEIADTDFDDDGDTDIDDQFLEMYGMTFADYMAMMLAIV